MKRGLESEYKVIICLQTNNPQYQTNIIIPSLYSRSNTSNCLKARWTLPIHSLIGTISVQPKLIDKGHDLEVINQRKVNVKDREMSLPGKPV